MAHEPSLDDHQAGVRRELLKMLWAYLNRACNYDTLYKKFYFRYADLQDDYLSDADSDAFAAIHEKLDFVAENPDSMSRRDGWISSEEYRKWMRAFLEGNFVNEARPPG